MSCCDVTLVLDRLDRIRPHGILHSTVLCSSVTNMCVLFVHITDAIVLSVWASCYACCALLQLKRWTLVTTSQTGKASRPTRSISSAISWPSLQLQMGLFWRTWVSASCQRYSFLRYATLLTFSSSCCFYGMLVCYKSCSANTVFGAVHRPGLSMASRWQ